MSELSCFISPCFYKIRKIRNARVTLKSLWSFLTRFKLNEAEENRLPLKYLSVALAETTLRDHGSDP